MSESPSTPWDHPLGNRLTKRCRTRLNEGVTSLLTPDPNRLFPIDAATRNIARGLYGSVAEAPIISPHGHVPPALLLQNEPFEDPAALLIRDDHYITRLLHASGVPLNAVGRADAEGAPVASPREAWRALASRWHLFAGTASGYWLTDELSSLFSITQLPNAESSDAIFDAIAMQLGKEEFRPRSLFTRFRIEVLATTDDPMDDLTAHAALAADPGFNGRVIPTFRPDGYIDALQPTFIGNVQRMADQLGFDRGDYRAYIDALERRRAHFIAHGAVSSDHGMREPYTIELDDVQAAALYQRILEGDSSEAERRDFTGHMLLEMARMSVDDGLVMTLHPGVYRNHNSRTFERFGADTGHDIPVRTSFTENLRPLLERFGTAEGFHLVLFTVDETVYSREIAPLAGFYPSVYIGAPWWFLDAPDAVLRHRAAVVETAGFYRSSGFIDDTRAFLSIPARHDMSRRLDAAFLSRLVGEGRFGLETAERIIKDLVTTIPRQVFKL